MLYTPRFNAKVALEAIRGERMLVSAGKRAGKTADQLIREVGLARHGDFARLTNGSVTLESRMGLDRLCATLLAKIHEQIERTVHLINVVPADRLSWIPPIPGAWPVEVLLGHLLECFAGFCAVLSAVEPERLAHFAELRTLPVNHACSPADALSRIALYRTRIDEGFALLVDSNLSKSVSTVFVNDGEPLLTLLLGNLEHLINHKHQLFTYLKEMGLDVGTRDLYQFRGEA